MGHTVFTPWQQGPIIGGEDPELEFTSEFDDFSVHPSDGTPADEYVFTVTYSDEDDDLPAQIHLFLDGKHTLNPANAKNKEYFRGVDYTVTLRGLSWGRTATTSWHLMVTRLSPLVVFMTLCTR